MVSLVYVTAVVVYFLVLYPYIITFVTWAVWAIEGLPPPTRPRPSKEGRSPSPQSTCSRLRDDVRRAALKRSAELTDSQNQRDAASSQSRSADATNRRTRLDQIISEARQLEEGKPWHQEEEKRSAYYYCSGKGKGREWDLPRWSPARATSAPNYTGHPNGVDRQVYMRVIAGHIFFHTVFCVFPFWFKMMNYSWTAQTMLPINMHDQD